MRAVHARTLVEKASRHSWAVFRGGDDGAILEAPIAGRKKEFMFPIFKPQSVGIDPKQHDCDMSTEHTLFVDALNGHTRCLCLPAFLRVLSVVWVYVYVCTLTYMYTYVCIGRRLLYLLRTRKTVFHAKK